MIDIDLRVKAVREDTDWKVSPNAVGRGSCSYIDETMDDAELLEEIEKYGAKTPEEAVEKMRELNALLRENDLNFVMESSEENENG
tara:strand:+ start:200 stop:457 length:258 start_codon:yes stop_codon:yes gene_type:complete